MRKLFSGENKTTSKALVDEWINNTISEIKINKKTFYLVKDFDENHDPQNREFSIVHIILYKEDLIDKTKFGCKIQNPDFSEEENGSKEFLSKFLSDYISLQIINRQIPSYSTIDFYPYFRIKPHLNDKFNMFPGFQMEREPQNNINFEDLNIFAMLRDDFFDGNKEELNHFLDHIADIIQDPLHVKPNAHFFYSKQGCGKGLFARFMSLMLGSDNVATIGNSQDYFNNKFNGTTCFKLLKIF